MGFPRWKGIPHYQFGSPALHKQAQTPIFFFLLPWVSITSNHGLCEDHSELQRAISTLIFLLLRCLITVCDTTARLTPHLLLMAQWQSNGCTCSQVHATSIQKKISLSLSNPPKKSHLLSEAGRVQTVQSHFSLQKGNWKHIFVPKKPNIWTYPNGLCFF